MSHLLWLIPLLPLAGFLVNGLFKLPEKTAGLVGCVGPIAALALSIAAVAQGGTASSEFSWFRIADWGFSIDWALRVDNLSGIMILVVTGVGSLIHVYSMGYMHGDPGFSRFFAYLNLFMFAMLILVLGDSIVLMFLGWEGVGLCSYLLIGFWYKDLNNADAGKKAFITNRVGDFGFLLGIFCLWMAFQDSDGTGVLTFSGMAERGIQNTEYAYWGALLLLLGACGKSAQIPLYVWLPDAMAGPTPVSALIHAATMVTAGVYMVGRMHFLYSAIPGAMETMALLAALTALLAGIIAVGQNDIKKILAYSTISQLGFMFAGMATANFTTGMFHVVTHAFFKALLFLGAGAVIHALHNEQDIRKMGGLFRRVPLLGWFFLAGCLALAGAPFTAGFVSKDQILAASYINFKQTGNIIVYSILVLTAGITAFYTARMFIIVFLDRKDETKHEIHKPGLLMMAPLGVLALLSIVGGVMLNSTMNDRVGEHWGRGAAIEENLAALKSDAKKSSAIAALQRLNASDEELAPAGEAATPVKELVHAAHSRNMYLSFALFALGAGGAWLLYGPWKPHLKKLLETPFGRASHRVVENKFYVDELYEYLIIAPVKTGSTAIWYVIDRLLIDTLLVNGTGWVVYRLGAVLRKPATGSVNMALGIFLLGALAALAWGAYRLLG